MLQSTTSDLMPSYDYHVPYKLWNTLMKTLLPLVVNSIPSQQTGLNKQHVTLHKTKGTNACTCSISLHYNTAKRHGRPALRVRCTTLRLSTTFLVFGVAKNSCGVMPMTRAPIQSRSSTLVEVVSKGRADVV